MIVFIYGQDSYRISQKLKELVAGYKAKNPSGLNLIFLDFTENELEDLEMKLKSRSLIPEKKLIIVKNILNADGKKAVTLLESYRLSADQNVIFIPVLFSDGAVRNELFQYLAKKPNLVSEFRPLSGAPLKKWLSDFAASRGVNFDGEALDFLVNNVGGDLWRQSMEIQKMADYKLSGAVRLVDIQSLINQKTTINIFDLTDAVGAKNKKKALLLWHRALENGESPTELLGLLAWHVRNLLKVKSADNLKSLNLHPYVLEKTIRQARLFQIDDLKLILTGLGGLDLAFKTSNADPKIGFLNFINTFS